MSRTKFKITTTLRGLLLSNDEIKQRLGDKIFPLIAPADTVGDFIVYKRDEYSKEYNKMGIHNEKCRVFFNVVSDDYDTSQELAELLNEVLEGNHRDFDISVKLADSTEDYVEEANKYIQVLLFEIE